jgi:hypothetical protein
VGLSAPVRSINSHGSEFYFGWIVQDPVQTGGTVDGLC